MNTLFDNYTLYPQLANSKLIRVVGHVVAKDKNPFFFGVPCKKTLSTGSKNLESITNVQKSLTFLLRTTAHTAISFVINSLTNPAKELQKRASRFCQVLNNSTYPFLQPRGCKLDISRPALPVDALLGG